MVVQRFDAIVASDERGRVYINLPFTAQTAWGKAIRYVKGTLNQVEYHASIGVHGSQYFMPLNKALQQQAHLKPGDSVSVTMEPDEAQVEDMPQDFDEALKSEPTVEQFFASLTAFQRNTYLKWITSAKKAETRTIRIQESIQSLKLGQKQR